MNKIISFIIPYIIVAITFLTTLLESTVREEVLAIAVGCLISIWYIFVHKTEGTKPVLLLHTLTLILLIVSAVLAYFFYFKMLAALIFITIIQVFVLYTISQNKPRYSYTYSYKNNKRRYF